jgi:biotin/methionine sulfoxide reductase
MNPADAAARGIADGDLARMYNDRGACFAGVRIDANVMAGVVVMATGAWFDPDTPGHDGTDSTERNGNPNVLSRDIGTSRLAQGPSALSVLVDVKKWTGVAPAVRSYEPPVLVSR